MQLIEDTALHIEDEIEDAKRYAEEALALKDTNKAAADLRFKLANEELQHMAMLHAEIVKMIEKYKAENGEPPADMMYRYDYIHKMHIHKAAKVKGLLAMYQG